MQVPTRPEASNTLKLELYVAVSSPVGIWGYSARAALSPLSLVPLLTLFYLPMDLGLVCAYSIMIPLLASRPKFSLELLSSCFRTLRYRLSTPQPSFKGHFSPTPRTGIHSPQPHPPYHGHRQHPLQHEKPRSFARTQGSSGAAL